MSALIEVEAMMCIQTLYTVTSNMMLLLAISKVLIPSVYYIITVIYITVTLYYIIFYITVMLYYSDVI